MVVKTPQTEHRSHPGSALLSVTQTAGDGKRMGFLTYRSAAVAINANALPSLTLLDDYHHLDHCSSNLPNRPCSISRKAPADTYRCIEIPVRGAVGGWASRLWPGWRR